MQNFRTKQIRPDLAKDSRGAIVPLLALALITIIGAAALSVDQGRSLMTHREVENLSDSLALSSVIGLDGTVEGIGRTTTLFDAAIRSGASGADGQIIHTGDFNVSSSDGTTYSSGDVTIRKEIGFYGYTAGPDQPGVFTVFSSAGTGMNSNSFELPEYFVANAVRVTVEVRDISNPFRQTLQNMLGIGANNTSSTVLGRAIALRDHNLEVPVAPIAIPACEFFQNHDPLDPVRYSEGGAIGLTVDPDALNGTSSGPPPISDPSVLTTNRYFENMTTLKDQLESQCGREIVAREPEPNKRGYDVADLGGQQRMDGILRAESYPRPPIANFNGAPNECYRERNDGSNVRGWQPNCKASPIGAILGVPAGGNPLFTTTPRAQVSDLITAITNSRNSGTSGVRAKIGTRFKPIDGSSYLGNSSLQNALITAINSGVSTRHGAEFNNRLATIGSEFYRNGQPDLNFPFRKNLWVGHGDFIDPWGEMRLPFVGIDPFGGTGEEMTLSLLMASAHDHQANLASTGLLAPGGSSLTSHPDTGTTPDDTTTVNTQRYVNPMCHTPGVGGTKYDTSEAPVWPAYAMLIAPSNSNGLGYCDFGASINDASTDNTIPTSTTAPIVVGFLKINLFDFRINDYSDPSSTQWLPASDLSDGIADRNDWALDIYSSLPDFASLLYSQQAQGQNTLDCSLVQGNACSVCNSGGPVPCPPSTTTACTDLNANPPDCSNNSQGNAEPSPFQAGASGIAPWIDDCFGNTADALRQLAADFADNQALHCGEVCGGVYMPNSVIQDMWANQDNFYVQMMQNADGSFNQTGYQEFVVNQHSDSGDYSWVGFDTDCMTSMINGSFDGLGCINGHAETPTPPRGSYSCDDVCLTAVAYQEYCFSAGIFRNTDFCINWPTNATDDCMVQCQGGQSGNNSLAARSGQYSDVLNQLNALDYADQQGQAYATLPFDPDSNGADDVLQTYEDLESNHGATQVCLPRLYNDANDIDTAAAWEIPTPRQAGSGCSGVRLRMSCEMNSLSFGQPFDQLKPAIVGK